MSAEYASPLLDLYLRKRPALLRFFTARTGSPALADDVVQELYFKIQKAAGAEILNGEAYLYRLGLNMLVDRYRADSSRRLREKRYVDTTVTVAHGVAVSEAPSMEASLDARKRLERLMAAVQKLPPQCQRVFRMHKLDGMSHAEVAAALRISRSAVEKHLIAALKQLSLHRG